MTDLIDSEGEQSWSCGSSGGELPLSSLNIQQEVSAELLDTASFMLNTTMQDNEALLKWSRRHVAMVHDLKEGLRWEIVDGHQYLSRNVEKEEAHGGDVQADDRDQLSSPSSVYYESFESIDPFSFNAHSGGANSDDHSVKSLKSEETESKAPEEIEVMREAPAESQPPRAENGQVAGQVQEQQQEQKYPNHDNDMHECQICFSSVPTEDLFRQKKEVPKQGRDRFGCGWNELFALFRPATANSQATSGCKHKFCRPCVSQYLAAKIGDGIVLELKCPEPACTVMYTPSDITSVVEDNVAKKYEEFVLQAKHPTHIRCPHCSHFQSGNPQKPDMTCAAANCGERFCYHHGTVHGTQPCSEYERENQQKSITKIKETTTRCPGCKMPVERSSGCNHMSCRCKHQFCYLCGKKWTSNHASTLNPIYRCPYDQYGNRRRLRNTAKLTLAGTGMVIVSPIVIAGGAIALVGLSVVYPIGFGVRHYRKWKAERPGWQTYTPERWESAGRTHISNVDTC